MLKEWLKNKLAGKDAKLTIGPGEENLSGLNLKDVLSSHDAWKTKLQNALAGHSDETLDVTVIARDDQCTLGKWLHGHGKQKYSKLPEFQSALKAHSSFHICAAAVLIEHQSGNTYAAERLLKSEFRSASNDNQLELVRLFTAAS